MWSLPCGVIGNILNQLYVGTSGPRPNVAVLSDNGNVNPFRPLLNGHWNAATGLIINIGLCKLATGLVYVSLTPIRL